MTARKEHVQIETGWARDCAQQSPYPSVRWYVRERPRHKTVLAGIREGRILLQIYKILKNSKNAGNLPNGVQN
jgi:hypothetical protein